MRICSRSRDTRLLVVLLPTAAAPVERQMFRPPRPGTMPASLMAARAGTLNSAGWFLATDPRA